MAASRLLLSKCARQFAGNRCAPRNASLSEKCDAFVSLNEDRPGRRGFLSSPVPGNSWRLSPSRVSRTISGQKLSREVLYRPVTRSETEKCTSGIVAGGTVYKQMALPGIRDVKIAVVNLSFILRF